MEYNGIIRILMNLIMTSSHDITGIMVYGGSSLHDPDGWCMLGANQVMRLLM